MSLATTSPTKLGYQDYLKIPEDGQRHEIIDGVHYVNPAPSTYHQTVSRRLQFQLFALIENTGRGQVFNAPVDLQLAENDIVQPDLVVILGAKQRIITPTKIKGVPDLIVEILSPSSMDNDRELKRIQYQAAGVPEYWIVDPFEQLVEQLVLRDGVYQPTTHGDITQLAVAPDISVDFSRVW